MAEFIKKIATSEGEKQIDFQSLGNFPVAQAGQLLKVKTVDENGKPTEWEAADVKETLKENGVSLDGGGLAKKIASYETAGSYEWTAPDLANGETYKIGVMIIGAGASGCSDTTGTGSSQKNYCFGGASGFSRTMTKTITPGSVTSIVVGKGGARVTGATSGKSGGASSFDGITAMGGIGKGVIEEPNTLSFLYSFGACPGVIGNGFFGMDRSGLEPDNDCFLGIPAQCFNPFEQKEILASGGGAYTFKTDSGSAGIGGKNPLTGKGGGNGAYSVTGNATATDATEPGCGGGSASAKGTPTSGAGADGAVYIYFLGVADE